MRSPFHPVLGLLLGSCMLGPPAEATSPGSGRIEASWTVPEGGANGRIRVPIEGIHCRDSRLIQGLGYRGDGGIGFSLYYGDSVVMGYYPVFDPLRLDPERPGAAMGIRWFTGTSLEALEGYGGWIALDTFSGDTIGGRFEVQVRGLDRVDTLTLSGRFERMPLESQSPCSLRRN